MVKDVVVSKLPHGRQLERKAKRITRHEIGRQRLGEKDVWGFHAKSGT